VLNFLRKSVAALPAALLLAALAGAAAAAFSVRAQQQIPMPAAGPSPATSVAASTLIVLDPAHGGADTGAVLADQIAEKDVTLALAARLRAALLAAGFTVASTRDSDPTDPLTTDQRAELANRSHPLACLVLHATSSGSGVHVYTSALKLPAPEDSAPDTPSAFVPIPWDTAQTGYVAQSLSLAAAVTAGLGKDRIPTLSAQAPLRPLDNLMCPAIAIEIAPLLNANADATPVTDAAYQQQVATTLANALRTWREQGHPAAAALPNLDSQIAAQSKAIAAAEAAGRAAARARAANAATAQQKGTQ
jgi:N-acetylmuramoyl-L-alanine amidase